MGRDNTNVLALRYGQRIGMAGEEAGAPSSPKHFDFVNQSFFSQQFKREKNSKTLVKICGGTIL
jgi:hypothetical protein